MKIFLLLFLILFLFLSCRNSHVKENKKAGFILGDWMMCKSEETANSNTCPTLTFKEDGKGSLRTIAGVDFSFAWTFRNNILTLKSTEGPKTAVTLINDRIYEVSTVLCMDCHGIRLTDTVSHIQYFFEK